MYISDEKIYEQLKISVRYLLAAIFTAFFGAVYEHFGRGVWSAYMVYAFAVPLVLGALPSMLHAVHMLGALMHGSKAAGISTFTRFAWGAGIAALTAGSIFKGVLDIYGTTNSLTAVYPAIGGSMLAAAAVSALLNRRRSEEAC